MRTIGTVLVLLALVACGEVRQYTDAGDAPGDEIDAAADKPDAAPDAPICDEQACGPSDGCCPASCHANNDPDCTPTCGNEVIEAGETCDPLGSCPTSCPQIGCQLRALAGEGTCAAACEDAGQQTACVDGDGCCPDGCNANNDAECAAVCGNGVVESGETCDPLTSCPTSCPQVGCTLRTLFNGGTCGAQCVDTGTQGACIDGDGCCAAGCNANNDSDCQPDCGNGVIEAGETCDGNCVCPAEPFTCFGSTGSASTCDLQCHVPVQACGVEDGCCPSVRGSGGTECNAGSDPECAGEWRYEPWYQLISWSETCATIRMYGMVGGDSVLLTTCSPPGQGGQATGDSVITRIVDNLGTDYAISNDDCTEPGAIPNLEGWDCRNDQGAVRMSCGAPNSGGFILRPDPQLYSIEVTICGYNNTSGRSPLYIWWNGTSNPNPG